MAVNIRKSEGRGIVDAYGFEMEINAVEQTARIHCQQRECVRERKWQKYVESSKLPSRRALKGLIRKGIPAQYRPWVWLQISGANERKGSKPASYYSNMVAAGDANSYKKQIELDLPRTFPSNAICISDEYRAALKNVLMAFAAHNHHVGYCQGLNNVAGFLLLVCNGREEDAFWILCSLVEGILYPDMYSATLSGCLVEMAVLEALVAEKLPKLHAQFKTTNCEMSFLATDWFLCLYTTSLPPEVAARVWDCLLFEGPKVLFRVALAVLKMHSVTITTKDNPGEIVQLLKDATKHVHDRDALMKVAFDDITSLPMKNIERLRLEKYILVQEMLKEREAARRRNNLKDQIQQGRKMQQDEMVKQIEEALGPEEPGTSEVLAQKAGEVAQKAAETTKRVAAAAAGAGAAVAQTYKNIAGNLMNSGGTAKTTSGATPR